MPNIYPSALKAATAAAVVLSILACLLFLFIPYLALDLKVVYGRF
jgi:hypothetical protein